MKIGWAPRALLWFFMGRIARQSKIVFRNVYTRSKWGLDLIDMILTTETSGMQKKGQIRSFVPMRSLFSGEFISVVWKN